jgi:transposase
MSVNALRGHLSEFGMIAAKGIGRVDELIEKAGSDATLPEIAKAALQVLAQHLEAIDASIAAIGKEIAATHAQSPVSRLLASIPGVGKIAASAIVASAPDPSIFKSGRDFAAWLGSTPRQNSSGGREKLGSITKRGNRAAAYTGRSNRGKRLRRGDLVGSRVAGKRKGALRDWLVALLACKPARLVPVALANKLTRIIWAMMKTGEGFRTGMFAKA